MLALSKDWKVCPLDRHRTSPRVCLTTATGNPSLGTLCWAAAVHWTLSFTRPAALPGAGQQLEVGGTSLEEEAQYSTPAPLPTVLLGLQRLKTLVMMEGRSSRVVFLHCRLEAEGAADPAHSLSFCWLSFIYSLVSPSDNRHTHFLLY